MKKIAYFILIFIIGFSPTKLCSQELSEANSIYQFTAVDIEGEAFNFSELEGQKILIVNTASKCMYAPQLDKLQQLYEKYQHTGFVVIAFPSNSFYGREPKENKYIAKKYAEKYKITFPVMAKVAVKGDSIHSIYDFLAHKDLNGVMDAAPKWNFHKYLIDENGFLHKSVKPSTKPFDEEIIEWVESEQ